MLKYIIKRLISLIPVIVLVTILLFALLKFMPGDPVRMMLGPGLKAEQYKAAEAVMRVKLGLDKSYPEQYFRWIGNTLSGELGWSSLSNRPVKDAISEPMRNTVILNIFVIILELAITLPVGIMCAVKRGSRFDNFWQVFSLVTYSMPSFFVALTLIYVVAINLQLLPPGGMPLTAYGKNFAYYVSWLRYMALPVITLTIISLAGTIRYVRNAMIDALSQDYIRTARSKGLAEKVVIYSHAFRNALIPISTIIIFSVFSLFSGSAITETVFAWNGIGQVLVKALLNRDFMLVSAMNLFFASLSITANFVADITYGLVDPRIKLE
ncbi:MAG: ABC transporter permease [Peptococcaceae bacterium]|nr:ABC transporter permease [Peptococcaceae bacterium]